MRNTYIYRVTNRDTYTMFKQGVGHYIFAGRGVCLELVKNMSEHIVKGRPYFVNIGTLDNPQTMWFRSPKEFKTWVLREYAKQIERYGLVEG